MGGALKRKIFDQGSRFGWGSVARRRITAGAGAGVSRKFLAGRKLVALAGKASPYVSAAMTAYGVYKGAKGIYNYVKGKKPLSTSVNMPTQSIGTTDAASIKLKLASIPKKSKHKVLKGIIKQRYCVGSSLSSTSGLQAVEDVLFLNSRSQVITSTGTSYNNGQIPVSYFNMIPEPYQGTNVQAGTFFAGRTQTGQVRNYNILLKYIAVDMDIINCTNVPVTVDFHIATPKGNYVGGALDYWVYNEEPYFTAAATAQTGTGAINFTTNSPTRNTYGASPLESDDYRKNWKRITKKSYLLAAAATQKVKWYLEYNQVINYDKVFEQASNIQKNLSTIVTCVCKGSIVDGNTGITGMGIDDSSVTWSATQVKMLSNITVGIQRMKDDPVKSCNANIVTMFPRTDTPNANQVTMNPTTLVSQGYSEV
jgi:hypothetical protein